MGDFIMDRAKAEYMGPTGPGPMILVLKGLEHLQHSIRHLTTALSGDSDFWRIVVGQSLLQQLETKKAVIELLINDQSTLMVQETLEMVQNSICRLTSSIAGDKTFLGEAISQSLEDQFKAEKTLTELLLVLQFCRFDENPGSNFSQSRWDESDCDCKVLIDEEQSAEFYCLPKRASSVISITNPVSGEELASSNKFAFSQLEGLTKFEMPRLPKRPPSVISIIDPRNGQEINLGDNVFKRQTDQHEMQKSKKSSIAIVDPSSGEQIDLSGVKLKAQKQEPEITHSKKRPSIAIVDPKSGKEINLSCDKTKSEMPGPESSCLVEKAEDSSSRLSCSKPKGPDDRAIFQKLIENIESDIVLMTNSEADKEVEPNPSNGSGDITVSASGDDSKRNPDQAVVWQNRPQPAQPQLRQPTARLRRPLDPHRPTLLPNVVQNRPRLLSPRTPNCVPCNPTLRPSRPTKIFAPSNI